MRLAAHGAPPRVACGAAPATYLQRIRAPSLHLHVLGRQVLSPRLMHLLALRFFFCHAFMTVVGLTCHTRAVSRLPLAFMAIATIGGLTSGAGPA
jgi:hypothetical protein